MWHSGFIGAAGFEIGDANFVGSGHKWQDAVYFYGNR